MTKRPQDRWIARYLRRLHWGQFLEKAAEWMAGYLFAFGAFILIVKLFILDLWPHSLWLVWGMIPVAGAAWLSSRRNSFTHAESVALIDRRLNAGGLVMTLSEAPDDEWEKQLLVYETEWRNSLPKLRPTRFSRLLVLPLVFACGACLIPLRAVGTTPTLRNTVGQQAAQQLNEMLQQLDDASILDKQEKQQLRDQIKKLSRETKHAPLTHEKWETVDALRNKMRLRLDASAAAVMKASDALATLVQASDIDDPEFSVSRAARLQEDIVDALLKLAANGKFSGASPELRKQLEQILEKGQFKLPSDAGERQELLHDLQDFLDREGDKLNKLRQESSPCEQCRGGT